MRIQAITEIRKCWYVHFGLCTNRYYTAHHAEQFARALKLNGTPYTMIVDRVTAHGLRSHTLEQFAG